MKTDTSIQLEDYIERSGGRLITATRNTTNDTTTSGTTIIRKQKREEKQLYGRFKRLTTDISHEKTWTWLSKWNLKKKTESLLITAQNNAIRTNHIKASIDKTQQNNRCRLYGDRDKTVNHIIRAYSKLAQKAYKARQDWVGRMIHWEMCKILKLDRMNKWYMHNPESVLENDAHKLLWDFDMQTDHLISDQTTRSYNNQQQKRELAELWTLLSQRITE